MPQIESDSADAIAAIHVVEHFYEWEVIGILSEWRRILKPGGKLILELPCMDKVFGYITHCVTRNLVMDPAFSIWPLYGDPRHQTVEQTHKWGWFLKTMTETLKTAGMRDIRSVMPRYHFAFRDMRFECLK